MDRAQKEKRKEKRVKRKEIKTMKELIDSIPTERSAVLAYPIDWDCFMEVGE